MSSCSYKIEYQPIGAKHFQVQNSFERNLVVDKSALVSHPVRDLFIWCIFTEHNELAKVLWKHGHEYMGEYCLKRDLKLVLTSGGYSARDVRLYLEFLSSKLHRKIIGRLPIHWTSLSQCEVHLFYCVGMKQ